MTSEGIERGFKRAVFLGGLTEIVIRLRSVILIPIIANMLGPAGYGLWSQWDTTVTMLASVAGLSLNCSFIRFGGGETPASLRGELWTLTVTIVVSSLILALGMWWFAPVIATAFFGGPDNAPYIQLLSLAILFFAVKSFMGYFFKATAQWNNYTRYLWTDAFLLPVIFLLGWQAHLSLLALLSMYIVGTAVFCVVLSVIILRQTHGMAFEWSKVRRHFVFALPLLPAGLALWASNVGDRYVLAYFFDMREVGIYSMAYALSMISVSMVFAPFYYAWSPVVSNLWNHDQRERALGLTGQVMRYGLIASGLIIITVTLLGPDVISVLATHDFTGGSQIVPIVAVGYVCLMVSAFYEILIGLACGNRWVFPVYALAAGINLGLSIATIPRFGMMGGAVATLIGFAAQAVAFRVLAAGYGVKLPGETRYARVSIIGLVLIAIAWWASLNSFGSRIWWFAGLGIFFLVALRMSGVVTREDFVNVRNIAIEMSR